MSQIQFSEYSYFQRRPSRIPVQTSCHLKCLTSCANKSTFRAGLTFYCLDRAYTKKHHRRGIIAMKLSALIKFQQTSPVADRS
ncbi:hypothetical protein TNCT_134901 [Trichonephila clavata]|uniref:Uncharacterized protein n=1 Tax=Trichonephila clavata TaxID=2740835 RepID=A0A8X6H6F8_TRICU|nr:hypothetical protein TNCT_267601 [Trichonephila clavata]GFR18151.1 hypothetical protein TNCT_134901 [Trichonephila clavata]